MGALRTEGCLTCRHRDASKEGYEGYAGVEAVGGTSKIAQETALRRVEQGGAQLTSLAQLACEVQRDWNRTDTVPDMVEILTAAGIFPKLDCGGILLDRPNRIFVFLFNRVN